MEHHHSKLFKIVELVWLSCCVMLYGVERSWISIKHLVQHRSTFLLFSCVNNKVALVWSRTRSKSSLRQGQQVYWPKIWDDYSSQISNHHNSNLHRTTCCIRLAMQFNTIQQCWRTLHSFGRGLKWRWKYPWTTNYPFLFSEFNTSL